jgi:HicB family
VKKIIDGKAYNTETARLLATAPLNGRKIDENRPGVIVTGSEGIVGESKLYETPGGAFFLVREFGDGVIPDPDYIGKLFSPVTDGIWPLSRKQAFAWAESKQLDIDKLESIFGKIPEAGEKSGSMLLRLPKSLKGAIDQAAANADQSANSWAMHCLERCTASEEIEKAIFEVLYSTRSALAFDEWSQAELIEIFNHADQQVHELAGLMGLDQHWIDNRMSDRVEREPKFLPEALR